MNPNASLCMVSKEGADDIRLTHGSLYNDQKANTPRSFALSSHQAPRQRQDSINNSSRFSFASTATTSKSDDTQSSGPFDFLPSVNFDDLQSSIASDGPDISSFPVPGRHAVNVSNTTNGLSLRTHRPVIKSSKTVDSSDGTSRIGINGSLPRRHNSISQQDGQPIAETEMTIVPTAPGSIKARRKSYFPTATSGAAATRPPRKSVGPGILTVDADLQSHQTKGPVWPRLASVGVKLQKKLL